MVISWIVVRWAFTVNIYTTIGKKTPPAAALAPDEATAGTYIEQLGNVIGTNKRTIDQAWTITGQDHLQGSLFIANNGTESWKFFASNVSFNRITKEIIETFAKLYNDLERKVNGDAPATSVASAKTSQNTNPPAQPVKNTPDKPVSLPHGIVPVVTQVPVGISFE